MGGLWRARVALSGHLNAGVAHLVNLVEVPRTQRNLFALRALKQDAVSGEFLAFGAVFRGIRYISDFLSHRNPTS